MVAKTGAHKMNADRFWEAFAVAISTLGTLAYVLSDPERRRKYDKVALLGVVLGSIVGSWGGFVILVDLLHVPDRVAAAFSGLAALLGGTIGAMIFKPSLRKFGVDLDKEK